MQLTANMYAVLAFFGISGCVYALTEILRNSGDRVTRRIEEKARERSAAGDKPSFRGHLLRILGRLLPESTVEMLVGDSGRRSQLQSRLIQAGLNGSAFVPVFATAKIVCTLIPVGVAACLALSGMVELQSALMAGAVVGGVGMLLPGLALERMRARRHVEFMRSLPDFLDLMIVCLSSGASLESALQRVTQELRHAHPMLATEMVRVQKEIGLGTSPDVALRNSAERNDLNALRSLAVVCQQARQFGTQVTDALRSHADMMRTQRELRAEERAQKATVKILFPTMLCIFPAVFVVLAGPAAIQIWQNLASQ